MNKRLCQKILNIDRNETGEFGACKCIKVLTYN